MLTKRQLLTLMGKDVRLRTFPRHSRRPSPKIRFQILFFEGLGKNSQVKTLRDGGRLV
jgi:hypothetical protein